MFCNLRAVDRASLGAERIKLEPVGLAVNRLIRISYGPFQLGELAAGYVGMRSLAADRRSRFSARLTSASIAGSALRGEVEAIDRKPEIGSRTSAMRR